MGGSANKRSATPWTNSHEIPPRRERPLGWDLVELPKAPGRLYLAHRQESCAMSRLRARLSAHQQQPESVQLRDGTGAQGLEGVLQRTPRGMDFRRPGSLGLETGGLGGSDGYLSRGLGGKARVQVRQNRDGKGNV